MENIGGHGVAHREHTDGLRRTGGEAGQEVASRLLGRELRDVGEDNERVAGKHDDALELGRDMTGNYGVQDESRYLHEAYGVEELLLHTEVNTLSITAALGVEDAIVGLDVFVVSDQPPCLQRNSLDLSVNPLLAKHAAPRDQHPQFKPIPCAPRLSPLFLFLFHLSLRSLIPSTSLSS